LNAYHSIEVNKQQNNTTNMEVWHRKNKNILQDKRLEERHEENMNRCIRYSLANTFTHNTTKNIENIQHACSIFTCVAPP
jgi:uncharacterized Rmd1/YagE family protein